MGWWRADVLGMRGFATSGGLAITRGREGGKTKGVRNVCYVPSWIRPRACGLVLSHGLGQTMGQTGEFLTWRAV